MMVKPYFVVNCIHASLLVLFYIKMYANLRVLLWVEAGFQAVASSTCYVSDVGILGSGNVLISNVLKCVSGARNNETASITSCMDEIYPSYGLVSSVCLDCITEVMEAPTSVACLPDCIQDVTSAGCNACVPNVVDEWESMCDSGIDVSTPSPTPDGSADVPPVNAVCDSDDESLIKSGADFVIPSLFCLQDLTTFQSCLATNVPFYGSITVGCKACASATSTSDGIDAEDCGSICMQQPASDDACANCANGLATSFDVECLHLASTSSTKGSFTSRILLSAFIMIAVIIN